MRSDEALRENVVHGTKRNPIAVMHFAAGPGTDYPEGFFVKRHWHSKIELILVRKGSFLLELNLEEHALAEGDIGIFNSGELHQITGKQRDTIHDVLLFDPYILDFSYPDEWQEEWIRPFLDHSQVLPGILHPFDPGYPEVMEVLERLLLAGLEKRDGWYMRSKILLLELFACLSENHFFLPGIRPPAAEIRKVSRYKAVVSYIEEHYGEPISLQQMAERIPCNSQYLCRSFKEIAGVTPIQYLILYRVERASALLMDTSQTILGIAMDCGFENVSYFIRKFKEIKGCTPKEYRKKGNEGVFVSSEHKINTNRW